MVTRVPRVESRGIKVGNREKERLEQPRPNNGSVTQDTLPFEKAQTSISPFVPFATP